MSNLCGTTEVHITPYFVELHKSIHENIEVTYAYPKLKLQKIDIPVFNISSTVDNQH